MGGGGGIREKALRAGGGLGRFKGAGWWSLRRPGAEELESEQLSMLVMGGAGARGQKPESQRSLTLVSPGTQTHNSQLLALSSLYPEAQSKTHP